MDLIREELLRQEKALELLLLGAEPQTEFQTQESLWQKRQVDGTQSSGPADLDAGEASPAGNWGIRAPREIWHEEITGTTALGQTHAGKTSPPSAGEMLERDAAGYGVTAGVIPAKAAAAGGGQPAPSRRMGRWSPSMFWPGRHPASELRSCPGHSSGTPAGMTAALHPDGEE